MLNKDIVTLGLSGSYRDVVQDGAGRVTWDSGWRKNTIAVDCRRLLAAVMRGQASTLGIQSLQVGSGDPRWDDDGVPPALDTDTLVDPNPVSVTLADTVGTGTDPALKRAFQEPVSDFIKINNPLSRLAGLPCDRGCEVAWNGRRIECGECSHDAIEGDALGKNELR